MAPDQAERARTVDDHQDPAHRIPAPAAPHPAALGLFAAFAVVLLVPTTRAYFGLTAPDPPVVEIPAIALVLWFVTVSLVLRYRVLERLLGLPRTPERVISERPAVTDDAVPRAREGAHNL